MLEVKIGSDLVLDADWEPYRPEDYEEKAVRYLQRTAGRRRRFWNRVVARCLMVSGGLFAWAVVMALLWG